MLELCPAVVVPAPNNSSEPASAMNILVHGGRIRPPPPGRCGGNGAPLNVGEKRCGRPPGGRPPSPDHGKPRRYEGVATQPGEEFLLAFRVGVARRCHRAVAVGEAAA